MRFSVASSFGGMVMAVALGVPAAAWAQPVNLKEGGAIFTCTAASGRKLTADRPIPECNDREQRVLNKDGSLRMVLMPSLTADERAAIDEAEKRKARDRAAKLDAVRRDRNLLSRYPNEPVHAKAREAALDTARASIRSSEQRLVELEKDRKPLQAEAEFYQGKPLPPKLKRDIDAIDVGLEAQRALVMNQQAEASRINALYDAELSRLRQLWGGAEPGSLGPLPQSAHATAAPAAAPAAAAK
jgi:hypothetical protein